MRKAQHHARKGTASAAFWWSLAAVHVLPMFRVAAAVTEDPAEHTFTVAILLGVIAFCLFAGSSVGRSRPRRPRGSSLAFVLAAVIAHHDAVGAIAPAELPPTVAPGALLVAAVARSTMRWRRDRGVPGGGVLLAVASTVDRLLPCGVVALPVAAPGPRRAGPVAAARGPPA